MSICFIWIPFGGFRVTKYITSIGLFYKKVGILLGGLSDCEELSGGYSQEMMGLVILN